jgi:hypothetical protein
MFESEQIDNDLKMVNDIVREYYGIMEEKEWKRKQSKNVIK